MTVHNSAPDPYQTLLTQALSAHHKGDMALAEGLYRKILTACPEHPDALHLLGVVALQAKQYNDALSLLEKAITLRPQIADYRLNRGLALQAQQRYRDAEHSFRQALTLNPQLAAAYFNLAVAQSAQNHKTDAETTLRQALTLQPNYPQALNMLADLIKARGQFNEAMALYQKTLRIQPNNVAALNNLGATWLDLRQSEKALPLYQQVIEQQPQSAEAHYNLATALAAQGQLDAAVDSYQQAIALNPERPQFHNNLGSALFLQSKLAQAAACFRQALQLKPDYTDALDNLADTVIRLCDWPALAELQSGQLRQALDQYQPLRPFLVTRLPLPISAATRQHIARTVTAKRMDRLKQHSPLHFDYESSVVKERRRIGYISTDFNNHATAHLIHGLLARHDRYRYAVYGYSIGKNDNSNYRGHVERACDTFRDVQHQSIASIAEQIHQDGIDILIDLNGYSAANRIEIFALRPAPVQMTYLGFPSTTGAAFFDYIITDSVVTPADQQAYFDERFLSLPHSYQVNSPRPASHDKPSRQASGLPEHGAVFCCFNNHYKIEPTIFDLWTRILKRVSNSVLWLLSGPADTENNLRLEAERRGLDPARLIFAERLPVADHLARYGLADVFLDTYFYNAHTTASDALWAGLPVITCPGNSFASRVGASLVQAAGLPELAVADFASYEERAVTLATDNNQLTALKQHLQANRDRCPLFDIEGFTRDFERGLEAAWTRYQAGEPPTSITLAPSAAAVKS